MNHNERSFFLICGTLFFMVAAAHLTRLIGGWEIEIAGWTVPHWVSYPGFVFPGLLSAWGFLLARRK